MELEAKPVEMQYTVPKDITGLNRITLTIDQQDAQDLWQRLVCLFYLILPHPLMELEAKPVEMQYTVPKDITGLNRITLTIDQQDAQDLWQRLVCLFYLTLPHPLMEREATPVEMQYTVPKDITGLNRITLTIDQQDAQDLWQRLVCLFYLTLPAP